MNLRYDPFWHFCRASFLRGDDVVAPLTAYFDASGSDRPSAIWTVGGWIGTVDVWTEFNSEWRAMLDKAPFRSWVKPDKRIFHAADLESRKRIYRDWTEDEKLDFQKEAVSIIERFPSLTGISCSLIKADWNSLGLELDTVKEKHPNADIHSGNYFVDVLFETLKNVRKWADAEKHSGPIEYYFEKGDIGMGDVMDALKRIEKSPKKRQRYRMERGGSHFDTKRILPLQAADIWAYECGKQMLNRTVAGTLRPRRQSFKRLWQERFYPYNTFVDREILLGLMSKAEKPSAS
jgi:ASC-1-like (ASCH) protein